MHNEGWAFTQWEPASRTPFKPGISAEVAAYTPCIRPRRLHTPYTYSVRTSPTRTPHRPHIYLTRIPHLQVAGAALTLQVDTSTATRPSVWLSYLTSYEGMGAVSVECARCDCAAGLVLDGHSAARAA